MDKFLDIMYDLHRVALDKEVRSLNYKMVPCPLDELASSQLHMMHEVSSIQLENRPEPAARGT